MWFKDEARVESKGTLTRVWAKKGTRPRMRRDQRHTNPYILGAVCPSRDPGAALIMPYVNTEAMTLHLKEISQNVARGAHAIVIIDGAGWHGAHDLRVPDTITLPPLPPYSPELNAQVLRRAQDVWQ
ncbi:MAG: transposase, partial [Methylocella sp.]